jgi:hypothetical protein
MLKLRQQGLVRVPMSSRDRYWRPLIGNFGRQAGSHRRCGQKIPTAWAALIASTNATRVFRKNCKLEPKSAKSPSTAQSVMAAS